MVEGATSQGFQIKTPVLFPIGVKSKCRPGIAGVF